MNEIMPKISQHLSVKNTACHLTSPLGPQFQAAPTFRSLENCQLILDWATSTPNDTRASAWPPRKATLAQDLVRSVPVTRMISSIRSISNPISWTQANQRPICSIIHLPKSLRTTVFSLLASIGRDNTAPCFPLHENETSPGSLGLGEYQ